MNMQKSEYDSICIHALHGVSDGKAVGLIPRECMN